MRIPLFIFVALVLFTGPSFAQTVKPVMLGQVDTKDVKEASGLASSATLPGHYWTLNDSGNKPEVYLFNEHAHLISIFKLDGAANRDMEEIAEGIGPVKGKHYVYAADIGDNDGIRKHIRIYRFREPETTPEKQVTVTPDVLSLKFPDGARDAETLLIDPIGKKIYIVSKREIHVSLYKTDNLFFKDGDKAGLQKLITLPYTWVTSGDISKDGHHIVIKTLTDIYYWHRNSNETVEQAMAKPAKQLPYVIEKQGEGITITPDNNGYVTISEGKNSPIFYYKWKF